MANTSSRMLRLLSLLQTHRYWPGSELADRLEVSARTLRRDIDRLRDLGYPVEANRGVDGGYQLAAGAALPPLVLDDEEAVALAIGLRAAAQASVAGVEEASIRALTKVVQVMPPRLRQRVDALRQATVPAVWSGGPTVDGAVLAIVAQACRDEERLRFTYTSARGEEANRHVEPHRLVSLGRRWYLVCCDLHREDWRSFRLDRLSGARATGMRFKPRDLPATDAAAFVRAGIEQAPTAHTVEALVHAPAETVRSRIGNWSRIEAVDEGTCRISMSVDTFEWPAFALGVVGAEFTVLGPPAMIDYTRDWAARFARGVG
jgi:predicted DNA-binding transcriptional regulator YafY